MAAAQTGMTGPHQNQPVFTAGAPLEAAKAAMVLLHGRGAPAQDILGMTILFGRSDFAYLAPQAANYTWYPHSFLSPLQQNEPGLSSGLAAIAGLLEQISAAGISPEKTMLLGFSQGGCLALEFAARNARRYGGVAGLSGGLIGPDDAPRDYAGDLGGTPVFLGCSDVDPHIPKERVQETTRILSALGAEATERLYPNMGHTVNEDEIGFVRGMMETLLAG